MRLGFEPARDKRNFKKNKQTHQYGEKESEAGVQTMNTVYLRVRLCKPKASVHLSVMAARGGDAPYWGFVPRALTARLFTREMPRYRHPRGASR